ncbi:MAG: ATP-dependent Clp protease ATP-binding subunit [Treponema sp.]
MQTSLTKDLHQLITVLSRQEALRVNAEYIEPEHILLALIRSKIGNGYDILAKLNVNLLTFELMLEQQTMPRAGESVQTTIPLSRTSHELLETACKIAQYTHSDAAGIEHLLLACTDTDHNILQTFFTQEGVSRQYVKKVIQDHIQQKEKPVHGKQERKRPGILQEYGRDLTQITKDGLLDPVIGRTREMKRVMQILSRRNKNNPVLVGEPGVGKTSIVEGLAAAIVKEEVPRTLYGKRIISLDMASVVAGTKYRGQFEERIKRIIKETAESKDIILFIDELHTLIGTGGSQGALDAANILKPALARGEIQCIGATTYEEYRKYFEKDAALERRFQSVSVQEPSKEETCEILKGIRSKYETHHHVTYSDETLTDIVELSSRYIPERFFPDKAIDVMDEAGALKTIEHTKLPHELLHIEQQIAVLADKKAEAITIQNFEEAAVVRDQVAGLQKSLDKIRENWLNQDEAAFLDITQYDIAETIALMTGIPVKHVDKNEAVRLASLEAELHKTIIGQDAAISIISNAIRRSRAGISASERPIGSFLFLGPTGVGKTLLAKALAEFLFGSQEALIRIDMSDYMEKYAASRLVGAPPGYVGFENGGFLTEKIRRKPYSVVLLDEIEKAHPDVFNLLLQVLEEGELQDNLGHTVNFKNTVIIMTGNIGSKQLNDEPLGFAASRTVEIDYPAMKKTAELEAKKVFSPEFLNRIDSLVVFTPLSRTEIEAIFELEIKKLQNRLAVHQRSISFTPAAWQYCIEKSYDPHFGARPLRRLFQTEIEDLIAMKIIEGLFPEQTEAQLDSKNGTIVLTVKKTAPLAVCVH